MPKLRHTKIVFAAVLSGVMAALLVCLLCWNQGWSPAWAATLKPQAGAPIGETSVSEPPVISTNAAKNGITSNTPTAQDAGQNAAAPSTPADAAGLAEDQSSEQEPPDNTADLAASQAAVEAQQNGGKLAPVCPVCYICLIRSTGCWRRI